MDTNRKLIIWVFLLTGLVSGTIWYFAGSKTTQVLSYVAATPTPIQNALLTKIQQKLATAAGAYSIYVYNLETQQGYGINENQVMPAASIMKVPIMQAVADNLNLTDTYTLQDADKRSGSGPIEFMDEGTVLTVRRLLEEMGKKSDNTAPIALTKMLPRGSMKKTFTKLGMTKTDFDANTTTAYDLTQMWKYLQSSHPGWMWDYLQESIYEERLPAGLPAGRQVVHKVGSDAQVWADSGIVDNKLIITILNSDASLEEAKILVPEVAKMIWDYEEAQNHNPGDQSGQKSDQK